MPDKKGRLPLGKFSSDVLERFVLQRFRFESPEVVVGPAIGVDFSAIRIGNQYLIVSTDPVTGAREDPGWYAVNVSCNDVAVSGIRPRFLEVVILVPSKATAKMIDTITQGVARACKKLRVNVVGGHSEVTPGLSRTIVICTAFGIGKRFTASYNAKKGDAILITRTAGTEGTSILANLLKDRFRNEPKVINEAEKMKMNISVVEEAVAAFSTGYVHAMHDATEGGLLGGLVEMSRASHLGFVLQEEKVPVSFATKAICRSLSLDPLKLISSGVLIMAVDPAGVKTVKNRLIDMKVQTKEIGHFTDTGRKLVRVAGGAEEVEEDVLDELWRVLLSHQT